MIDYYRRFSLRWVHPFAVGAGIFVVVFFHARWTAAVVPLVAALSYVAGHRDGEQCGRG